MSVIEDPTSDTSHLGRFTWARVQELPEDGLRREVIGGTLVVSPSPMARHQIISFRLQRILDDAAPSSLVVLAAPFDWRYDATGDDYVEPDLVCFRAGDVELDAVLRHPAVPVLLVEIFSPRGAALDRTLKRDIYETHGVPHYWLVDPGSKQRPVSVTALHLVDGRYEIQAEATGDDLLAVTDPFELSFRPVDLLGR